MQIYVLLVAVILGRPIVVLDEQKTVKTDSDDLVYDLFKDTYGGNELRASWCY